MIITQEMSAILSCQLLQYAIFVIECTRLHQVIYQLSNFQMLLEKLLVVLQLAYLSGISALCETSTMVHETKRAQFIDDAPGENSSGNRLRQMK